MRVALAAIGPAFLGAAILSGHHLLLSEDLVSYIGAAQGLGRSGDFTYFDGTPFVLWPPLLPLILFLGGAVGLKASAVGLLINVAAWFGTAFLAGLWMAQLTNRWVIGLIATFAVSVSYNIFSMSRYLWSEPIFTFFVLISLYLFWKFMAKGSLVSLFLAAVFCALATLTRYAGLYLWVAEAGVLLFACRQSLPRRAFLVVVFSACCLSLLFVWLVRNYVEAGAFTGAPLSERSRARRNRANPYPRRGGRWRPSRIPEKISELFGGLIFLVLVAAAASAMFSSDRSAFEDGLILLGGSSCIYLAMMVATAALMNIDFEPRSLNPFFVPMIMTIALAFHAAVQRLTRLIPLRIWRERTAIAGMIAIFLVTSLVSLISLRGMGTAYMRVSSDYGATIWSESRSNGAMLAILRTMSVSSAIRQRRSTFTPIGTFTGLLGKRTVNMPETSKLFEQRLLAHRENLLIWFDQEQDQRPYLDSLEHLSARFGLSLVKHFPDANVYVIGAR